MLLNLSKFTFPTAYQQSPTIMKYILLVYGAEDAWTQEERQRCMQDSIALCHDLHAKGQYLGASPLQSVATATSVSSRDGKRLITDGPFAETAEQLGGYFLIDVANLDEAIAVADRIPGGKKGTIEIRPIFELELPELASRDSAKTDARPVALAADTSGQHTTDATA
jgi:hypothetical protein